LEIKNNMLKRTLTRFMLPIVLLLCNGSENSMAQPKQNSADVLTGTIERMLVANGVVSMDVDLKRLNGDSAATEASKLETLHFTVAPESSFFTFLVFNNALRGPEVSSMTLSSQNSAALPAALKASLNQLAVAKVASDEAFDLVVRDSKTGFVFFNIDGHSYDYNATQHVVNISGGRLLVSSEFAKSLGRPAQAGSVAGKMSIVATVYPIEIQKVVNGELKSAVLPPLHAANGGAQTAQPANGTVPGPDVIVGDLTAVSQGGSSGTFVGLGVGTTSCNQGVVDLDWFQLPSNDHPVIPQNLYRMSGGSSNTDRFEQVGQSWLKHAFTALMDNICNLGCDGVGGTHLGSGCSDPYSASLNYSQSGLGSRAFVNPFTGFYPGSNPNPANHTGHTHTGTSHRVLVAMSDLSTASNPGATYFAEGQYVTPHEYAWCQAHAGQCNMYNNVSYRQFTVSGTTSFTFSAVAATVRTKPGITAWTGATINQFEPVPGTDGIGMLAYKVTNPSAGVWHYEYAVYNENLDRAIQSFSVPLGCGVTASNLGFHAPTQEPGWTHDGTVPDASGFSSTPWVSNQTLTALSWNSETLAQNVNANAIRWGTLYNFRFDSNKPPQATNATVGFFKTGSPITVAIQGPTADPCNPLQLTSVVSRKTHGAAGDFDVNLPLSGSPGVECRSTGGNDTFIFTFSNNVVSGNASVTGGSGGVSGSPTFSGNTMTVNLTGVGDDQQLTVTASGVMDTFGQTLPDTAVNAIMLIGDTNANGTVNSSDVAQTKSQIGAAVDATNFREDINASGTVNATDVGQVKNNLGKSYP
jgi:hypothetical protein